MNSSKKKQEVSTSILLAGTGKLYQSLFENSKSVMIIVDPLTGCIADVNKAAVEFYGYKKEKLLSMNLSDINQLTPEEILIELNNARIHGVNYFNFKHRLFSGEIKSVEVYTNPIEFNGKEYLFSIIHDISEKKELEEKLLKSEEKYRQIFESSMDGILLTNPNGEILDVNTTAENILGMSKEEINKIGRDGVVDFSDPNFKPALEERKRTGRYFGELKFKRKDGTIFPVEISSNVFTLKDGSQRTCIIFRDITEKKKSRELLSDAVEFNQKVFNSLFVGKAVYNSTGQCISANDKFIELVGASKELILSQNFKGLESWKKYGLLQAAEETLNTGRHIQKDIFVETTFAKKIWIELNTVRFYSKGEPHLLLMFHDITERMNSERILKASEEKFSKIFHSNPAAMTISSVDNGIFYEINDTTEKITGFTKKEVIGKSIHDLGIWVNPEERDEIIKKLTEGEVIRDREIRIYKKDRQILIGSFSIDVIEIDGKKMLLTSIVDITGRKSAEEELKESKNKLQGIFDAAPIGFGLIKNRILLEVNKAFFQILNYTPQELIGRPSRMLYQSDEEFERVGREVLRQMNEKGYVSVETKWQRKNGSIVYILLGSVLVDLNGHEGYNIFTALDISERKHSEEIIAESQAHLNTIINSTQDLIWSVDSSEFTLMKFNSAFDKLFSQLTEQDLYEGIHFLDLLSSENVLTWKEYFRNTLDNNYFITEFYSSEIDKTFSLSFNTLKRDDKIFGISVFGRDITEIKKHENQIRELADDLQKAQKVSHVGSWKWFIQTNKLEWSDEMYRIFGIKKNDYSGNLTDIFDASIHPADREAVNDSILSVIKSGNPVPLEYRIVLPDKNTRTVWTEAGELMYDKENQPYLLTGIVQDITEQKKIEADLRVSNERYSKLVATIPDVIVRTDILGNITFVSEAIIQYWGFNDIQNFINKNIFSFVIEKDRLRAQANMVRVFSEHVGLQEYTLSLDGREIETEIHADVLLDSERQSYGLVFVIRDITRRRKVEKELEEYRLRLEELVKKRTIAFEEVNRKLEEEIVRVKEAEEKERLALEKEKELSELKSKFISITSHEFRTPLTTLLSSVEILEMAGKNYDDNKRNTHYQKIKNNIEFLVKMIDELLYLNRIDSSRIKVSYLKTNILEFCTEIYETIKEPYKDIEALIESDLEKPDYNIDRAIVHKILSNLLVNAFKFNKPGGKVNFAIYSKNYKLQFKISDTGIGIPKDEQNNVFEPFSRMSNSQHVKGTGLGLSIVKKSVEQLGGSVSFMSNQNGTIFTVIIPCNL